MPNAGNGSTVPALGNPPALQGSVLGGPHHLLAGRPSPPAPPRRRAGATGTADCEQCCAGTPPATPTSRVRRSPARPTPFLPPTSVVAASYLTRSGAGCDAAGSTQAQKAQYREAIGIPAPEQAYARHSRNGRCSQEQKSHLRQALCRIGNRRS